MFLLFKHKLKIFPLLIILLLISTISFAEDDFRISNWIVNSTLLENGDLKISEDITFNFTNPMNGVFRNIVLERTNGITGIKVYEIVHGKEILYSYDMDAKKGHTNRFKSEIKNNIQELMIFSPSQNENKTFRINYTLNDVAIKHKDTGELYYKFLGHENNTPIDYFSATISLPSIDKNKTQIFAHGPANGKISFVDQDLIKLQVSHVPARTFVEARVLFPSSIIPASTNLGYKSFDNIIDEELSFEQDRQRNPKAKALLSNISIIGTGIGALFISLIFNKSRRNTDIYRNLSSFQPKDITPGELRLFQSRIIDSNSLIATIFDLGRKGYVSIQEDDKFIQGQKGFLITNTNKPEIGLLSHEIYLLDWLFNLIGDGKQLSTSDIDSHRKKPYTKFFKEFKLWQSKVKSDLKDREYYDHSTKSTGVILILLSLVFFIISILTFINNSLYGLLPLGLGLFIFIFGFQLLFRKSDIGYIQDKLWKDYKKNLKNQGKTPENYNQVILEDKDLIYGLALGLPMKSLNNFRKQMPQTYMASHWMYWYFLTNSQGGSRFEDSFNSSFYGTTGTTNPTSFGGGGGFSGGGGGGAGGGGAGGF